jgi:hypothetical protein
LFDRVWLRVALARVERGVSAGRRVISVVFKTVEGVRMFSEHTKLGRDSQPSSGMIFGVDGEGGSVVDLGQFLQVVGGRPGRLFPPDLDVIIIRSSVEGIQRRLEG